MTQRTLAVLAMLGVLLAACGLGGNERAARKPSPTAAARAFPTRASTPAQAPTRAAEPTQAPATPAPTEAVGPVPTEATSEATPPAEEVPPDGEEFEPSEEARAFATRLQDAAFALEDLPGYEYTVTDPGTAPGLVLRGRVASPERREWVVSELGAPEHIVARWVVTGGKTYTDYAGEWEVTDELPFDADAPVSFAGGYFNQLFEPFGGPTKKEKSRRRDVRVRSQPATRYDLERELEPFPEEAGLEPGEVDTKRADSAWIARDGGYLLRYSGPSFLGSPGAGARTVEVTPLRSEPEIRAPRIGERVFEGAPPPWRASVVATEKLEGLKSYRFSSTQGPAEFGVRARGRVSESQGALSGTVPDYSAVEDQNEFTREQVKKVDVGLVYIGRKAWARTGREKWRRAPVGGVAYLGGGPDDAQGYQLLLAVPTGPPEVLLGEEAAVLDEFSPGVFGVSGLYGLPVLTRAKLVGTEKVNGVRALHYRGSGSAAPTGAETGDLDVWIAAEGHYLVRSRLRLPAPTEEFEIPVRFGTNVDVYDANKPFTVQPPVR